MHFTNTILQLGVFAASVSAFYPYYPEYKCIEDGTCLESSKRLGGSNALENAIHKGAFEMKIKKSIAKSNLPHHEKIARYVDQLRQKFSKRSNEYSIIPSVNPGIPNSAPISQEGSDFSYMGQVRVGSQGQALQLLLDTGAASSWVMSKSCKSDACIVHDTFDRLSSTSLVGTGVSYVLNYGTGKVNGEWVTDNVAFAGYNVNMHFLSADTLSYHFNNYPMDGILGLARVPEPEHPGFIHSLVNQGLLNSNTFAVNLHRMSDQTNDGSIVFGGVDPSKFSGNITYVPTVADNSIWGISVGDAGFNGQKAGLGGRTAVIDTGTSYAFMPEEDAKKFYALLPEATVSEDGGSYTVPCDTTIPAQFTFGGVTYEVSAKDWVGGKNGDGSNTCTSNIYSRDASGQGSWLLGDTFLKNVYAVFDMGNNQIGFAHKSIGSGEPATSPAKTSEVPTSLTSTSSTSTSSNPPSTADSSSTSTTSAPSSSSTMVIKPIVGGSFNDSTSTTDEDGSTTTPDSADTTQTTDGAPSTITSEDPDSAAPQLSASWAVFAASFVAALALIV